MGWALGISSLHIWSSPPDRLEEGLGSRPGNSTSSPLVGIPSNLGYEAGSLGFAQGEGCV